MQMFIAFKPEDGNKSKDVLVYFAHCLDAEIREGSIGHQKGWMFIFNDDLRPFRFGGKRKYTVEDENAVADDIRKGKSLRRISKERHMGTTTVHTLHKRYLARNPQESQFPVHDQLPLEESPVTDENSFREASQPEPNVTRSDTDMGTSEQESTYPLSETDTTPPSQLVPNP